jgi:hypothetical protein
LHFDIIDTSRSNLPSDFTISPDSDLGISYRFWSYFFSREPKTHEVAAFEIGPIDIQSVMRLKNIENINKKLLIIENYERNVKNKFPDKLKEYVLKELRGDPLILNLK